MNETKPASALSLQQLGLALLSPLFVVLISYVYGLHLETKLLISVFRTIVQLFIAGYFLLGFVFASESPLIVVSYLSMMIFIAAIEATGRQSRTYKGHFLHGLLSIFAGGIGTGIFSMLFVMAPTPWWNPQIIIPTCGMLIGNSISGPALGVERLLSDVCDRQHEVEIRLAFGATKVSCIKVCYLSNYNNISIAKKTKKYI